MKNNLEYVYPACIYPNDDGTYTGMFPDLKGCVTQGDSLANILYMLKDAGCGWILTELEDDNKIPPASNIKEVKADEYDGGFVSLIVLDVYKYSEKYSKKAIRKNCTIPYWLDVFASKNNISLSSLLQDALINLYQESQNK